MQCMFPPPSTISLAPSTITTCQATTHSFVRSSELIFKFTLDF
uniref:Agmatine deiminase n=1 Tax=Arundo donax TaxID=35708 RepID=A0A0A9F6F9_ARUDO